MLDASLGGFFLFGLGFALGRLFGLAGLRFALAELFDGRIVGTGVGESGFTGGFAHVRPVLIGGQAIQSRHYRGCAIVANLESGVQHVDALESQRGQTNGNRNDSTKEDSIEAKLGSAYKTLKK